MGDHPEERPEDRELRRTMRDLVALATLPAIWIGHTPEKVAESLGDALVETLSLDLVYIQMRGSSPDTLEVVRSRRSPGLAEGAAEAGKALAGLVESDISDPPPSIPNPFGGGELRIAMARFGHTGIRGALIAGSQRPDFPTEADRLLLGLGANQAAVVAMAQQARRDADQRKDEFLATLAHELRNPLAPIQNAVRLLRIESTPEPARQWARDVIDRQVGHLSRLVEDLLDLNRISRNQLELRMERVSLSEIMQSAIESSRPGIEAKRHQFMVSLPDQPIYLDADLIRLAQVFTNLLNNAARYTPPGGRISLTVERQDGQVVTRIKDTGVGIAPEQLPRLFDMFFQARPFHGQGGLGIGLSLSRYLVEKHQGAITPTSAGLGAGFEVTVTLLLARDQSAPIQEDATGGGKIERAPRRRVLVVDDNQDAVTSLAMLLEHGGNEVHTASDGLEALEAATRLDPDVLLLDLGLPKLSGHKVAERIRQQPWGKRPILIALTGWGQEQDRRQSREAGFDGHLVKPVAYDTLIELLLEAERARSAGEGAGLPSASPSPAS